MSKTARLEVMAFEHSEEERRNTIRQQILKLENADTLTAQILLMLSD